MKTTHLLLALLLVACGSDEEHAPQPTPVPSDETSASRPERPADSDEPEAPSEAAEPETAEAEPLAPKLEIDRPEITATQRRSLQQAMRAGRRAARRGDFTEADARFREAVAIDPYGSRTRCEAGFVAFKAGDLDRARHWIDQALASMPANPPESIRVPRAMCLYNAGLVYQAQGRTEDARRAWTQSLALRANATVQGRLDALGEAPGSEDGSLALNASAGFGAHRDVIRDFWCEEGSDGFARADLESCSDIAVSHRSPEGTAAGLEAEIVELRVSALGESEGVFLVLRADGAVKAYRLADTYNPGAGGISADHHVEARYEDLLRGGSTELRVEVHHGSNDEDMGLCERSGYTTTQTIICSADGGELRCGQLTTSTDSYFEHEPCEDWDTGEMEDESAASEEHEGYAVVLQIANGSLNVTDAVTGIGTPPADILGTHPMASFLDPNGAWVMEAL